MFNLLKNIASRTPNPYYWAARLTAYEYKQYKKKYGVYPGQRRTA